MRRGTVSAQVAVILAALMLAVVILTVAVQSARADTGWQWQYKVWMKPVWQRIVRCETGTRWDWNSGTYQGAFGFYRGSWDAFRPKGYPTEAYLATPWQQYRVALRIYARYGFSGWGCYTHHAWVRG